MLFLFLGLLMGKGWNHPISGKYRNSVGTAQVRTLLFFLDKTKPLHLSRC